MGTPKGPEAAFVLSLVGGVLILTGSVVVMMWAFGGMPTWSGPMSSMMGGYGGMMGGMGFSGTGVFSGMSFLGLIAGVLVLVGAIMLRNRPEQATTWGTIILVFSIVSLFGMGGFFIGAILGFVGGILAATWKPPTGQRIAR